MKESVSLPQKRHKMACQQHSRCDRCGMSLYQAEGYSVVPFTHIQSGSGIEGLLLGPHSAWGRNKEGSDEYLNKTDRFIQYNRDHGP